METHLKAKIARLPELPGVYFFKDTQGKIVYIGKAKSIKQRVQSYFTRPLDTKTMKLVSCAADIAYTLTPSESQALLLEAGLIRKYKPKYNVSMRGDKSFPYVKITNEQFPAVCITRQIKEDGALYLGPYTSAKLLRQALKVIRRSFPFRSCRVMPQEACMYYRLGLSPAPCAGKADRGEYMRVIKNIRLILEGRTGYLINKLSRLMRLRSRELKYEEAAKFYDRARLTALSIDDRTSVAESINNLGSLYLIADEKEKARGAFEEALRFNREIKNRHFRFQTLTYLYNLAASMS